MGRDLVVVFMVLVTIGVACAMVYFGVEWFLTVAAHEVSGAVS